ncbi:HNH endonuclease family protein [Streptomyces apocyni]|uniref:HNH endonuclease family protein n=1 Tax=Streptomyces apocyni TaxID=2654677 RepID=UPI0012EAA4E2|nr:HNH endonuclease family protein [Streptomyces apocyni]
MRRRRRGWWLGCVAVGALIATSGCGLVESNPEPDGSAPPTAEASGGTDDTGGGTGGTDSPGDGKPAAEGTLPNVPTVEAARTQLAGLKVAPHGSMSGYSRSSFSHWAQQGDKCDSREVVLERDGKDVQRDDECKAVSGTWVSAFDGVTLDSASKVDIDHIVPLANAWRSGAARWDADKRKAFANDLEQPQLIAASASSNRSKGDQGPDEWQPPEKSYWCTYGRAWTAVKSSYELSVTESEKGMLKDMLDTCES